MTDEREEVKGRALGISINAQVDQGRVLVFQTHVDADMSAEKLDELLDKLNVAADRQAAFYEIPGLMKAVRLEEDRLNLAMHNIADMEAKKALVAQANGRRTPRDDAAEKIAKTNAMDQLQRQKEIVAEVKAALADVRTRAGVRYGAASSANS